MLFNSLAFVAFLPMVFILYQLLDKEQIKWRNLLLLTASYFFYGYWDVRFLSLIFLSTLSDYLIGQAISNTEDEGKRKRWMWLSLLINLGILSVFKYAGFFVQSFADAFMEGGIAADHMLLHIVLPVGISFYTFQSLSYTLDIYYRRLQPSRDPIAFFTFVAFFPQLVAGPIERASHLLPQFQQAHPFDRGQTIEGLQLMLWGLFKKLVIADRIGQYINPVFEQVGNYHGLTLILVSLGFAIQIYCDFSGYSDIAIGTARLFGFELRINFRNPYFAYSLQDFWNRWHISLSTWFRDYLYIPLGGNRTNTRVWIRNLLLTFLISGLWHGANWTFIIWGALHGMGYVIEALNRKYEWISVGKWLGRIITILIVCVAWIFFRANTLSDAGYVVSHLHISLWDQLSQQGVFLQTLQGAFPTMTMFVWLCGALMVLFWVDRHVRTQTLHEFFASFARPIRWIMYYGLILAILFLGAYELTQEFIYFQF